MDTFGEILSKLPDDISRELELLPPQVIQQTEEIRLICGQSVRIQYGKDEKTLTKIITKEDLQRILNNLIKFSYYAYEDDLAKGFVTIEGGHRVGICGKTVLKSDQPTLIKEISSMNIRFAKEIRGCASALIPILIKKGKPVNKLIVSPPGCGKTTLLRDIARILSRRHIKVAICDERSEIAGMYDSKPSFDLGPRTDVLDGCDKVYGIPMLIRSMSPDVIITDEMGKPRDVGAADQCAGAGVSLITSIHGSCEKDIINSSIGSLIHKGAFDNIIYLSAESGPGTIKAVVSREDFHA